jgi:uncharacterized protein (TIGR02217 family)
MAFFEERFPDEIAQGATGGPRWKTTKGRSAGGSRFANKDWSDALHFYEVSQAIKSLADFEAVRAFFYVVAGSFDGFRFKDFTNFRVAQAVGVLELVTTDVYQMHKAERYGSREYLRRIRKPVEDTVTIYRTRSAVTSSIAASIDYTTGLVTVSGHVVGDTYAWAGEFDVPVNFADDSMESAQHIGDAGGLFMDWGSIALEEDPNA